MIRIQVTHYNGAPPPQPLFGEFNESGGNIGRADGNALVLHDPTRTISRTHASIICRDGDYSIRNLGTATPVYINGQPLGNGRVAAIAAGDEIRIGSYTMKVLAEQKLSSSAYGSPNPPIASKDDPLALFGGQSGRNPFGDLLASPIAPDSRSTPSMQAKNNTARIGPAPIIPPDFDPFGSPPEPSPRSIDTPSIPESQDILGLGLGSSLPDQSIDELFGLRQGKDADLFSSGSPSSLIPAPDQSGNASVDPLVALGAAAEHKPSPAQAQRDDVLELQGSFRPPEAKPDTAMRAELPEKPQTPAASSPEPYGMVLSWESKEPDRGIGEITSVIVPSPGHERRKAERRRREQPPAISLEPVSEKVAQPEESVSQTDSAASPALPPTPSSKSISGGDALLGAFLEGAGVPDLAIANGLTPQFMNILGQLLRESTQGTLDLLLARTLTKREVRAELTMIAPRENNPLKFSPTVEAALAHLLAPQGRGFMTPLQAMKDAHDDLRAHQFGFMAGMRAALAGVLDRFDPEELERRLTQKTVIDTLLPINRKAKLWDLFAERYKEISHEAEEDFHALFGKEFLRAYEAQIAKLDQDGK